MDDDLPPPTNNMQVVPKPHEEPGFDTDIELRYKVIGGVQDYIRVLDRKCRSTKPPER